MDEAARGPERTSAEVVWAMPYFKAEEALRTAMWMTDGGQSADAQFAMAQVLATLAVANALDRIEIELRQISGPLGLSIDGERAFRVSHEELRP